MLCTTSSSAASDSGHGTDGGTTTGSKWSKLNEADLLDVLKNYYRLSRQCQDKRSMIKDSTLIQLLGALLTDKRPSIAVYICKILLSLSERPEDAKALADIQQLRDQMNKALSIEDENVAVQPRIYSKLLVIQTRITNPTAGTSPKDKFTKKSKQLVFAFDPPTESQRKDMERKCCQMPGVVSVCFQTNDPNETRCLIRCSETVEDKAIIRALISAGNLEMVKQFVRVRGFEKTDVFEFYASQLDQEDREAKKKESLPKYLDDDPQLFDPTQCIATKEQVGAQNNGEGWFSTIKTFLW